VPTWATPEDYAAHRSAAPSTAAEASSASVTPAVPSAAVAEKTPAPAGRFFVDGTTPVEAAYSAFDGYLAANGSAPHDKNVMWDWNRNQKR
jgi:hypothetical protein